MEQGNRLFGIAGATLTTPVLSEVRRCTRCREPALEDSDECERHAELAKARKRRYAKKRRAQWRKKKRCTRCGGKRHPRSKWGCARCLIELGQLRQVFVDRDVDRPRDLAAPGFVARLEQSPDGKLRARRRFGGQGKRGRQSIAQLDAQDRTDALKDIDHGFAALEYFRSPEVQAMPKIQRDDVKAAALAKLRQAQRWLDDVIERHSPKSRKAEERSEDE